MLPTPHVGNQLPPPPTPDGSSGSPAKPGVGKFRLMFEKTWWNACAGVFDLKFTTDMIFKS